MTKTFDPGFAALLEEAKVETDKSADDRVFRKWLVKEDVLDIGTFVGLASSEDKVLDQITKMAESSIGPIATQGARGKIVTLRRAARSAVDRGEQVSTVMEDGKPIPGTQYTSLKKSWKTRRNFLVTAYRILAPVAKSRMWNMELLKPNSPYSCSRKR